MSEVLPTRRRWYQFGLGTLFVVVTVLAIFIAYHVNWIRQRHAFLAFQDARWGDDELSRLNKPVFLQQRSNSAPKASGLLWVFGESGCAVLNVWVSIPDLKELSLSDHKSIELAERLFPEASVHLIHHSPNRSFWSGSSTSGYK
jgi:hypothetical protein